MNDDQHEVQYGERLVAVESAVKSIRADVANVAASVADLTQTIQRQSRPNWQNYIGFGGLLFALVGAGMVFVDMRIENSVLPLQTKLVEKTSEIETQFNAWAQVDNIRFAEQQRVNSELWNSSVLGKISPYPTAPFSFPNISKNSMFNPE